MARKISLEKWMSLAADEAMAAYLAEHDYPKIAREPLEHRYGRLQDTQEPITVRKVLTGRWAGYYWAPFRNLAVFSEFKGVMEIQHSRNAFDDNSRVYLKPEFNLDMVPSQKELDLL